ncbi:MAG: hypothetical protein RL705_1529 [Bacteroidota bacterium]|jgi:hypothetical protein
MFKNGLILTKDFPEKIIIQNKKSRKNKHLLENKGFEFHWKILKRENPSELDEAFYSYMYPKESIGFELTNLFLLEKLKSKEIFDFDYEPEEFDNLQIFEKTPLSPYLSFIFLNGEWKNEFPHFNFENSLKHYGYVKPKD